MSLNLNQDDAVKEPTSEMSFSAGIIGDLLEMLPYAAIIAGAAGRIVAVNCLAEQLFGYAGEEFIGRPIDTLLPERYRARHAAQRANYMVNPKPRSMGTRLDLLALLRDGRELPVEIALSPLALEDELCTLTVVRDISRRKQEEDERRRSQEQMHALSDHLVTIREEERSRISRMLHDELGQLLTGLKMDLVWLQRRLQPDHAPLLDKTKDMSELLDICVQTVRQVATDLRPGILDDFGLEAAIEWQLQDFQRRTDIRCTFSSDMKGDPLDAERATTIFRILQEALTNVFRHANARLVEVVLTGSAIEVTLLVCDDGRGITADEINDIRSIGLLGMRERARMRGGRLEIQGVAGGGTTVSLRLPLTAGEEPQHD